MQTGKSHHKVSASSDLGRLFINRKHGERIVLVGRSGEVIVVTVHGQNPLGDIRLSVSAPKDVSIDREEIYARKLLRPVVEQPRHTRYQQRYSNEQRAARHLSPNTNREPLMANRSESRVGIQSLSRIRPKKSTISNEVLPCGF
jgi:sRNA-binding carbon storage regulator CsrA